MSRARLAVPALAAALVLLGVVFGLRLRPREATVDVAPDAPPLAAPVGGTDPSLLHGRVTTLLGGSHEGTLRWGCDEEAAWGQAFNGTKAGNRWAELVAPERLPTERQTIRVLGLGVAQRERRLDLTRPFMARFGDLARIDADTSTVRVTLKSGTVVELDRMEASDFDDGICVADAKRGLVELDARSVTSVEFLDPPPGGAGSPLLRGTVRTASGEYSGLLQWNRRQSLGSDRLSGRGPEGPTSLPFDSIRSLERLPLDGLRVELTDGRSLELSGHPDVGSGNRGVYVDDPRFGRVLVSWEALERVDFEAGAAGPSYSDFPPGRPLIGRAFTHDRRELAGRIVFDLDESETTETLDAPRGGVSFSIPFGRIASIVPPGRGGSTLGLVSLHDGTRLDLESAGDLGEGHAGLLVFAEETGPPEYLRWEEVDRIELDGLPVD